MGRAVLTTAILIGLLIYGFIQFSGIGENASHKRSAKSDDGRTYIPLDTDGRNFLPQDNRSDIVHHAHYSIGYNSKMEVPNWVAYKLTEASLKVKNVPRAKRFNVDNDVAGKSAKHSDYSHSGYTRGHMAPAGDMAFSKDAMQESFYMSNMTPQLRALNNGIWRELEENVRDWAYDNDELYIVSGPLFYDSKVDYIGKSTKVAIPDAFFKVILDLEGSKKKGIAFIIPHEKTDDHLREFAVTIDEAETQSGFEMFSDLILDDDLETELEGTIDVNRWQINKKRFNQRVNHWNKEK